MAKLFGDYFDPWQNAANRTFLLIMRQFIGAPNHRSMNRDGVQTWKKSVNSKLFLNSLWKFGPHRHKRRARVHRYVNILTHWSFQPLQLFLWLPSHSIFPTVPYVRSSFWLSSSLNGYCKQKKFKKEKQARTICRVSPIVKVIAY
jgi:hypothetical protein